MIPTRAYRSTIFFFMSAILAGLNLVTAVCADAGVLEQRCISANKVIVLVIDDMRVDDIKNKSLINLTRIANHGIIGLMNTRTKSFKYENRAAAYLTIGMGTRVRSPEHRVEAVNKEKDESLFRIVNTNSLLIGRLKEKYPDYVPGKIGDTANKSGKKIALLGNSDVDYRQNFSWLMAMDNTGSIKIGDVGNHLLLKDSESAWGKRTQEGKLLISSREAVKDNDIVFIDFGDTTRVAEARERLNLGKKTVENMRNEALKRADSFLGELIKVSDSHNAVLLVISPTSANDNTFSGIKNLAPVFIYKKDFGNGIVTSNTTRREGLISNLDIAPGIFSFLGLKTENMDFTGEKVKVITSNNPLQSIQDNYQEYTAGKIVRYIVHGLYVVLMLLIFYFVFVPVIKKRPLVKQRAGRALSVIITAMPVVMFTTTPLLKDIIVFIPVFLVLLSAVGYVCSRNAEITVSSMAALSLITSLLITADLLLGLGYLVKTPLGFNDVFTGGRYYGLNNDSMGVLLGSTVFGTFFILERIKLSRIKQLLIITGVMFLVVLSQTPAFGANVGGTIAAVTTGIFAFSTIIRSHSPGIKKLSILIPAALAVEAIISFIDSYSGTRTHAGKIAAKLFTYNFGTYLIEILASKLSVFMLMLVIPPWNIIFFMQAYIYYTVCNRQRINIKNIETYNPLIFNSFKIIFCGAIAAFVFNDTGIIAAALMLIYISVPLGVLLVREGCQISEYRTAITQKI